MLAVEHGHLDTVIYLISNSAIVNARDIHGRTALHRGVSGKFNSIALFGVLAALSTLGFKLYAKKNAIH